MEEKNAVEAIKRSKGSEKRTIQEVASDEESYNLSESLTKRATALEEESEVNLITSLLSQQESANKECQFYIDERIDKFLEAIGKSRDKSKSQVLNQLMYLVIADPEIMEKVTHGDSQILDVIDKFNRKESSPE